MLKFLWLLPFSLSLFGEIPAARLEDMPPMNQIYHPVSTVKKEAQESFNKGLTYCFAYNHDLAYREFEKAAASDPTLAMAYWGMAFALGQNINTDVTPDREIRCYELVQKAVTLAPKSSLSEQAYIAALVKRYTNNPAADLVPLRADFRNAMKEVAAAYPEDLDASTLYAESILSLTPWDWWSFEGKPSEGVYEAVDVLESVLERNPDHIGANHFYIHAFEESPYPERALMSAHRLTTLLPDAGHLLHMPCHIFMIVGDYEKAIETNLKAIAADRAYIKEYGMSGEYPLHYLPHNMNILTRTYMLRGDYDHAIQAAMDLNQFLSPYIENNPHLAHYAYVPFEVYLYFHKWKEILEYQPLAKNSPLVQAYQHFSRAVAHTLLGDLESARKEQQQMAEWEKKIPENTQVANNSVNKLFQIADLVLNATLSRKEKNLPQSIDYLNQAVAIQDHLFYDEPPAWFMPLRQTLGATLLELGKTKEAQEAFKKALQTFQRNGRLLFGLSLTQKAEKRTIDTYWIEREMKSRLLVPLNLDDL